jgi:hypothetical protein
LVAISCSIYELTLGGTLVELTVPPALYILTIGSWAYAVMCIHAYFLTLEYDKKPADPEKPSDHPDAELDKPLVIELREVTHRMVHPRNIWDDGASDSSVGRKSRTSVWGNQSPAEPFRV